MNTDFRQIASKLSPRGWLAVGGAALVGVIFVYALFSLASSPSYTTIVAGVQPSQTGKITSALSAAGIPYQLANNGTAVAVQSTDESQARVALDGQGLLGVGGDSSLSSLLGKSSLGESSAQQQEELTSALEQQLDQQIESMNGINTASVTLAIPNQASNLFAATNTQPTGSVLLNTTSDLNGSAVKAIADMVAGDVTGLQASKVTVSDQDGNVLWPNASTDGGGTGTVNATQTAEQAYDSQMATKADALLATTLGAGKAIVQVSSNLNTDQETQDSVTYGNKGTPLTQTTNNQTLTNGSGAPGASNAAGNTATNNAASYASGSGNGKSNYKSNSSSVTNGVDKTVSHKVIAPGEVNSQTISVLLNSNVPKADIPTIQAAVENAVGYKAGRDTISVGSIPFAKVAAPGSGGSMVGKAVGYVKYLVIGIGSLLFLLFIARGLRRRENEGFVGNPKWLRELEMPRPLAALEAERQMYDLDGPAAVARLRPPSNPARQQIEDLVDRDPERVASQVRQWMTED